MERKKPPERAKTHHQMKTNRKEKRTRRKLRGMNTGMLILLAAALLAVNISVTLMEKRYGWRGDYSFNGITTQSRITQETLRDLPQPKRRALTLNISRGREHLS